DSRRAGADTPGEVREVVVLDRETQQPMVGLKLVADFLDSSDGRVIRSTEFPESDRGGRTVWRGAPEPSQPVRFRVVAGAAKGPRYLQPIARATTDTRAPLVLEVQEATKLDLSVSLPAGAKFPAEIRFWSAGFSDPLVQASSSDGKVSLDVAPGRAKVFVAAEGAQLRVVDVSIPRAGIDLGEIRLAPGGTALRGKVRRDVSAPIDEVRLRIGGASVVTRPAEGRFEFRGLPAGDAKLVFLSGKRELFSRAVTLSGDEVALGMVAP
ncbi:MAG: hypothetical protein AAF488_10625, partial [Planctomycetota bacterium]